MVKDIEAEELNAFEFMQEFRKATEKWKARVTLEKNRRISFNIQDIGDVDAKVCDLYPRMDLYRKKHTEKIRINKVKIFQSSPEELDNESYKNDLVYSAWTINDIINFAVYHITEVNNGTIYFDMVQHPKFEKRYIPALLELHR